MAYLDDHKADWGNKFTDGSYPFMWVSLAVLMISAIGLRLIGLDWLVAFVVVSAVFVSGASAQLLFISWQLDHYMLPRLEVFYSDLYAQGEGHSRLLRRLEAQIVDVRELLEDRE